MLRKYAGPLLAPDANQGGGSSPPPAPAKPDTAAPAPTEEQSFADVAQQAFDKATKAEGGGDEGKSGLQSDPDKKEGEEVLKEEQTPELVKEGEEKVPDKVKEPPKEAAEADPDAELPFHEHPRWKEVMTQKKEFETKATTLETRIKEVEPTLQWVDNHVKFMSQYGITDQEFNQAMSILALQKSDPAQARKLLQPVWEGLQQYDENYLPPDVQQMVDDSEMTPAAAKEFAKLKAQLNGVNRSGQLTAEQQERNRAVSVYQSVEGWDRQKRGVDPDFKPKSDINAPDGLWEMTASNYAYLNTVRFAATPEQAQANLEEAYKKAKAVVSRLTTVRQPTAPQPTSMRSSNPPRKKQEDMTTDELVASVAARHGIHWSGRKPVED